MNVRARDVTLSLLAILVMTGAGTLYVSWHIDGELSRHGWIALGLGVGATLALAVLLLALVFISHHRGIDDRVNRPDDH